MTLARLETKNFREATTLAGAIGLALALTACVQAPAKQPLGNASFNSSATLASADYAPRAPGAAPTGVGGAAPTPTATGAAGSVMMPLTSPMQGGAAGTGKSSAGTGAGGAAGTGSAGKGAGGMGAAAGMTGAAGTSATVSAGTLTIDFTTSNLHGTYAPQNVGVVWIETSDGKFVRTLERWAAIRAVYLRRWTMASGGWNSFFGIGANADEMDAVSKATLTTEAKHHVTWDLKDTQKQLVADGMYKVWIEAADDDFKPSASAGVDFAKGPMAQSVMPPDMPPWTGLSITYQP